MSWNDSVFPIRAVAVTSSQRAPRGLIATLDLIWQGAPPKAVSHSRRQVSPRRDFGSAHLVHCTSTGQCLVYRCPE
ncbi:MAG: hypothetical protein M3464_03845 [Chloroflexota bacterium]|nr:hypothetical protein [Chloroflexota bacterium]